MQHINLVNSELWLPSRAILIPGKKNIEILDDKLLHTDGDIVRSFEKYIHGENIVVASAYTIAAMAHNGQVRENGEPYMSHLLGVYLTLKHSLGADTVARAVGLLHDVLEDTDVTLEQLMWYPGYEVAFGVDGMTKPPKTSPFQEGHSRYRTKFNAYARRYPSLKIVRIADRLHNMRTLDCFRGDKRERIAAETQRLYLPLSVGTPIHKELEYLTMLHMRN